MAPALRDVMFLLLLALRRRRWPSWSTDWAKNSSWSEPIPRRSYGALLWSRRCR